MTDWRVRVHPDVVNVDLAEALAYYGDVDPSLPERLADDFASGLRRIEVHPTLLREYLEGQRRLRLVEAVEAGGVEERPQHREEGLAMAHLVERRALAAG